MISQFKSRFETNILVVDDTPDNLRLLAKILESQGYTVRKSLNGRMALQAAHRDPPDLILLDIHMPDMNGYEVCQQLKASEETCKIPIIFISALDRVSDKLRAFELGGHDYITKPFQELEVLARIKNLLLIQQQQKQLREQQQLLLHKNQQLEREIKERHRAEAEVKKLNADLEERVRYRTLELQRSLNFEATLKRISDKVRDSLNQHQILQDAVEELAVALGVKCCDAVLYSSNRQSSVIRYQYVASGQNPSQGQLIYMAEAPEIYSQLQQQKSCFVFCQTKPNSICNHSAILACPIFDDQVEETGILGDLWLFQASDYCFGEMETHLVQQVANQCAIALRQARLYEASQGQVIELQRLNKLKDDFLCSISHELRSPIASMKMVIKLLMTMVLDKDNLIKNQSKSVVDSSKISEYFTILEEECDRELNLIEDLLSMQDIEAGNFTQNSTKINLQNWILHIVEPFESRTKKQQQILELNLAPNLPILDIDPLSLSRILTELLSNACKYTPAEENISVSVNVIEKEMGTENNPRGTDVQKRCFLQLNVTNTGVEISPEELPHIFDKFYRIPNNDPWKYGGTGLGLALVKKLVEQIGGSIVAESANKLTQFVVLLPLETDHKNSKNLQEIIYKLSL